MPKQKEMKEIMTRKGDTAWSIAEEYYGGGKNWLEVVKENEQLFAKRVHLPAGAIMKVRKEGPFEPSAN